MSLFDVIRYPLSEQPTTAELEALPKPLLEIWFDQVPYGNYLRTYSMPLLSEYLSVSTWRETALGPLHKVIREYDNLPRN